MIIRKNKIEAIAVGRYEQTLKSQFVLKTMPSWLHLMVSTTADFVNNGIAFSGKISSLPIHLDGVEQIAITISNMHWQSLPTNPSLLLVNGQSYIGLAGDRFVYNDGNNDIIDEAVGMVEGAQVWSWCKTLGATNFFGGSKNITLIIQPWYGYYHILHNGEPVHSGHYSPLSLSDDWHWEINSGGKTVYINGVEIAIQQNI
jgi:hypothetical protein